MAGRQGSLEYSITQAMVDGFQWDFFLRDRGDVGVAPGLFSIDGDQWKGMRDEEPIVLYFGVIKSSLQGTKRFRTGANRRVWSFLSSVRRCLSSGGVTTVRRRKGQS
jgi:hypothetical protein